MALVFKSPQALDVSPSLAFGSNVRIDWTKAPRGLKTFFLNSSQQLPDLCGGTVSYNGIPGVGLTAAGPAFDTSIGTNPASWVPVVSPGPSQCSMEAFIYYKGGNNYAYGRVVEGSPTGGSWDRVLGLNSSSRPIFYIYDGAGVTITGSALTTGNFYHLVGTSTGSLISIYVNGVSQASAATANGGYTGFTNPVFNQGYGKRVDGTLGTPTDTILHTAFADKAWTAAEVQQRFLDMYGFLVSAEGEMPALNAPAGAALPFIPNSNDNFNVRQTAQRAAAALLIVTQPFVPFNTTQVVPAVAKGWYNQLSTAPNTAKAQPTLPTQFSAPYQNTIAGIAWHRWQDPVNGGVRNAKAQPTQTTQFAVPASVAPPAQTPGQFGWWANLSKSAPVAQAKPGNAFVPFNTAQVVISPQTVPLNYDAGSVQSRVVYYQSSFQVLRPIAVTPNTITGIAWFQPLGIPAPVAQAKPGNTFVPFNTTQIVIVPPYGWYQPLGRSAPVATAWSTLPTSFATPPAPPNTVTIDKWQQPLSRSAPVARIVQTWSFVPFNTTQVIPVQIVSDPFVKRKRGSKRREDDLLRHELEVKYKRRLAIEEAFWPPTTYELPPYQLPEHVKPAPDVSDLANVIMQVQQMRAAQARQQDEEDEKALLELLKREYGIEDV